METKSNVLLCSSPQLNSKKGVPIPQQLKEREMNTRKMALINAF